MADTVQYLLEQMIPELEDLERKGYFTRAEVKKIVQKRQNFEYLLKRRTALKEDFYRYIEFEMNLEELRRVRKHKLGIKGKKSLSEVAIVRRIHFIYERAGRKFRSDLGIWMRWIETCKRYKSTKQLSKVITKALQRHSTVPELWIEAARWEWETNNDIAAARSLMQQGIRMCRKDETIWVQYYNLELMYALKLRVRRQVLGLDDAEGADGEGLMAESSVAAVRAVMQGGIARIVFKNAVATLPGRLSFRARFLALLRSFEYSFVEDLLDQIYDSIRHDFCQVEDAWDLLARRHLDFPAQRASAEFEVATEPTKRQLHKHKKQGQVHAETVQPQEDEEDDVQQWDSYSHKLACAMYEEGLGAVPTARMYQLYSGYLGEMLARVMEVGETALQSAVEVAAQLFELLQRAHSANCSTPATYLTWADWAEKAQQPKMALKAACAGCERFPTDMAMWRRRLQLELEYKTSPEHAAQDLLSTFEAALQATKPDQACEVWQMAIEILPPGGAEFSRLCDMLAEASAKTSKRAPTGGLGKVAAELVAKARSSLGLGAARQLYKRLLSVPGPGGDLYRCAISLEREAFGQQATVMDGAELSSGPSAMKVALKQVTDLYEAAVAAYGATESDLWIDYAKWLVQCGRGAGRLYWRATKELADPDGFVQAYREVIPS